METSVNNLNDKTNSTMTYGDKRRAEKKDSLREFVKGQQYIHAINKDLDREISPEELPVVKFKTETRLKLLSKVIPDLKAIEHSTDPDNPFIVEKLERLIIDPANTDS